MTAQLTAMDEAEATFRATQSAWIMSGTLKTLKCFSEKSFCIECGSEDKLFFDLLQRKFLLLITLWKTTCWHWGDRWTGKCESAWSSIFEDPLNSRPADRRYSLDSFLTFSATAATSEHNFALYFQFSVTQAWEITVNYCSERSVPSFDFSSLESKISPNVAITEMSLMSFQAWSLLFYVSLQEFVLPETPANK